MNWTSVQSSALQAAGYAEGEALLYLLFRSGEIYRYFDVPPVAVSRVAGGGLQRPILRTQHSGALPLRANASAAVTNSLPAKKRKNS